MKQLSVITGFSLLVAVGSLPGCSTTENEAVARLITGRSDLIGGPGALGDVGDFLLQNDKIRIIVQNSGYSRGFGVYGGALIDADIVRPRGQGDTSRGGNGYDNFGELFPGLFLKGAGPSENGIRTRQNDDGSASIIVDGTTEDFLFMLSTVNDVVLDGDAIAFRNEYRLHPGKSYVEITTTIRNDGLRTAQFPGPLVGSLTGTSADFSIEIPTGDVLLFGAGNKVFAPKAGFDLRFTLEEVYRNPPPLPQLAAITTPFIASKGDHVSYGFSSGIVDEESAFIKRAGYPDGAVNDLVIPFVFSAFTAAFYGAAPPFLDAGESFSYKKYFIVGDGDVAAIRDVVHDIRSLADGRLSGRILNANSGAPAPGASIITFDSNGDAYSQHTAGPDGVFTGRYEPGEYSYVVTADGRFPSRRGTFTVAVGQTATIEHRLAPAGRVVVSIAGDDQSRLVPGKCVFVGTHDFAGVGADPADFLFNRTIGESHRSTDLQTDTATDASTRRFIEAVVFSPGKATASEIRPGTYDVTCSRGIEYEIAQKRGVRVAAGRVSEVAVRVRRAFETPGWASGDFHLHQQNSLDSDKKLEDRVIEVAAEGVDIALSSDHNYVTDLGPAIAFTGLSAFMQSMVGIEMTTLEIGHFNAFPLGYDPGPITKGSFEWSGRRPDEIFGDLRALGKISTTDTIVQINHPRDSLLGYFNGYNFDSERGIPQENTSLLLAPQGDEFGADKFSYDFDAIEVFNGKRLELLRTYRVPETLPPEPLPETIPEAGEILRDEEGQVAFPGAMDDWFTLLNRGYRYTGTGNSDSHDSDEEPGYPRTYVKVANDTPGQVSEQDIVDALKGQRAMVTNGPYVSVFVDGKGLGSTVDAQDGQVNVNIKIASARWVEFNTVNILVNGLVAHTFRGDRKSLAALEHELLISDDAWVVVEVLGDRSMFPIVAPLEVPSLQISDAIGGLAGALGLDLNPFGNLRPSEVSTAKAYAFTNPIYIDADGDGAYRGGVIQDALRLRPEVSGSTKGRTVGRKVDEKGMPTVLRIFKNFGGH